MIEQNIINNEYNGQLNVFKLPYGSGCCLFQKSSDSGFVSDLLVVVHVASVGLYVFFYFQIKIFVCILGWQSSQ